MRAAQPDAGDRRLSGPDDDAKCARCLLESQRRYRLPARLPDAIGRAFWASVAGLPAHSQMVSRVADRRRRLHEALAAANLVVCPSRYLLATFARFGFDTARFTFMRQGIVKPPPEGASIPRQHSPILRIGYLGQLKAHKGIDLLVDAVGRMLQDGLEVSLDLWGIRARRARLCRRLEGAHRALAVGAVERALYRRLRLGGARLDRRPGRPVTLVREQPERDSGSL